MASRDLTVIKGVTHAFVENYSAELSAASGERHNSKGYKYYSEGYIKDIKSKQQSQFYANFTTRSLT